MIRQRRFWWGQEEKAGTYFSDASGRMQVCGAAMASGVMSGSYKEALAYSRNRQQGGRKIIKWSEVQMILSDMALKTDTSGIRPDPCLPGCG